MTDYAAAGMAELRASIAEFNRRQLDELEAEHGLKYLGQAGPVYLLGKIRARALFVDADGGHWTDGRLVAESLAIEYYVDEIGGLLDRVHDAWVVDLHRGLVDAVIAPLADIAEALDLPAPELFPRDNWCRSWSTLPTATDSGMLALLAAGWAEPQGEV